MIFFIDIIYQLYTYLFKFRTFFNFGFELASFRSISVCQGWTSQRDKTHKPLGSATQGKIMRGIGTLLNPEVVVSIGLGIY